MASKALKKLPIGIERFDKIITDDFYYVDKTGFIEELLDNWAEVNLFTRPRRFGKSLTMSMLKAFFEIGCHKELFEDLKISQRKDLCEKFMGKYPVIFITLKDVDGLKFESAYAALKHILGDEALRFYFLKTSEKLTDEDKDKYKELINLKDGQYTMSENSVVMSLKILSELLAKHYGQETIILIDEYDVPLDKAFQHGYYDEMTALIRSLFSNALKTNLNLKFAVLTGCLRISKESIFTGLNNLKIKTIMDTGFDEYFGFTDDEVRELLKYYGLFEHYDSLKKWYDGYKFGNTSVYCPWDVISCCDDLKDNPNMFFKNYWANTSANALVRRFIDKAGNKTRNEIEQLIAGESVTKNIRPELTYSELDDTIDNLWSVLFLTGYLTQSKQISGTTYELKIPNLEIRNLFIEQIQKWFDDNVKSDKTKLNRFCEAFPAGDAEAIETIFNDYLWNTISIRDTMVSNSHKENFYHGILLGLLSHKENWEILSNPESGEGYSDILVEVPESRTGIVIEIKYAKADKLKEASKAALVQIADKKYDQRLHEDGMKNIVKYGIACCKKHCQVSISD
jgi:hypothetical protein